MRTAGSRPHFIRTIKPELAKVRAGHRLTYEYLVVGQNISRYQDSEVVIEPRQKEDDIGLEWAGLARDGRRTTNHRVGSRRSDARLARFYAPSGGSSGLEQGPLSPRREENSNHRMMIIIMSHFRVRLQS